jgi:hypothetical protein
LNASANAFTNPTATPPGYTATSIMLDLPGFVVLCIIQVVANARRCRYRDGPVGSFSNGEFGGVLPVSVITWAYQKSRQAVSLAI